MKNTRVLLPVLAGCLGYALGLLSGRKEQDGNAVLYWMLIAALGLGLIGGALVFYKKVTNGK